MFLQQGHEFLLETQELTYDIRRIQPSLVGTCATADVNPPGGGLRSLGISEGELRLAHPFKGLGVSFWLQLCWAVLRKVFAPTCESLRVTDWE